MVLSTDCCDLLRETYYSKNLSKFLQISQYNTPQKAAILTWYILNAGIEDAESYTPEV